MIKNYSQKLFYLIVVFVVLSVLNLNAQTTIINPLGDGGFNNGTTFAANGWTVANQGTGATKWVVGNNVSASNVGTTQATTATGMTATTYTVTLSAANTNIAIGQLITGTNIQIGTYVSNISGTTLTLSRPTTNIATISSAVTLTFAAISANITGNSAYVSTDNGLTNGYNYIGARRVYFYRDVVLPAGETAYSLTFDVRSFSSATDDNWQVFVAPTSVVPVGLDSQNSSIIPSGSITAVVPAELAGAVSLSYGPSITFVSPQNMFASIPPSFAGQTVRLIFMWTNNASGGTSNPAAIDNIKLTSRVAGDINSVASGIFSNPSTWDIGVPTAADNVIVNGGATPHSINIDKKQISINALYISGANAQVEYGYNSDELALTSDLLVSGTGARFNNYFTTTGKSLKVAGNIDILSGGRFDSSVASTTYGFGLLTFNGSIPQTFTVDNTSYLGSSAAATTTSANLNGILGQVVFNNTSVVTPNIFWNASCAADVRIKSTLTFTKGRVAIGGTSKFVIGNYANMSDSATGFSANALQGITSGIVGRYFTTSANSVASLLNSATDYSYQPYPFINLNGAKRHAFIVRPTLGTAGAGVNVAGEVYVTYVNATTLSAGPVVDGAYTIDTIYDGTWSITKDATYVNTSGTDIAFYATGAFNALDGSSRILKSGNAAASGSQVVGTSSPLVIRSGVTTSDLFSGAFKVGAATTSIQGAATKTSIGTGNWNTASIWSPSGVPSCSDIVAIASGNSVTVSGTASAAGVNIAVGGTLTSSTSGNLTVGCTNNNAAFVNNGTYTITAGTIKVNGSVVHNPGSTFNQTGGNIIVDANNAGDVATSVGLGASAFKIDSPLALNLSAGTLTIVDPLVNIDIATTATTVTNFNVNTLVSVSTGITASYATGSTTLTTTSSSLLGARPFVGQVVTGTGIAPGTTISAVIIPGISATPYTITLSQPTTADLTTASSISFSAMANGSNVLLMADLNPLSVGQIVTGTGIPTGTTITSMSFGAIILSNPVSGLTTSPIAVAQTLTFSGASSGCASLILAATNSAIVTGMTLTGAGIPSGTTVTAITSVSGIGSKLDISNPATSAISAPVVLTFYKANPASYAFVYNSPLHNVAGMNHTLQFGNGISTDNASVITNGFLASMSVGGGILSLGNLTVDAVNSDRFVSSINKLNVQNTFTVNTGSVFMKAKQSGTTDFGASYFGGNIINNGAIYTRAVSQVFALDNLSNGGEVPSTIAQTISGTGVFSDTYDIATINATYGVGAYGTGAVASLTVNNTSAGGVTIAVPNFRVESTLTMNNGIIHTSSTYPLYHGVVGSSSTASLGFSNPYSNTCFIDGPYEKVIGTGNTTQYALFPVGKSATFTPISLAINGGGIYRAEAYTTNSGTASSNIANLSNQRWVVQRIGTTGTPSSFFTKLGSSNITSANYIPVQASADQGTYDNVLGSTATYLAALAPGAGDVYNNITTTVPTLWPAFTGYFSYATAPNCSGVPNPGNTIADLTSSRLAATQNATSTGIVNGSTAVTLSAANVSIVVGLTVSGTGIQPGTTVTAITTTALTLSLPATQSSTATTPLSFYSVSSPTSLCGSQTATLSLQNATSGLGLVYQWQSSTDGITYADILGATATTYGASPIVNTYYKCNVSCGANTGTSTAVQLTVSASTITGTTPAAICSTIAPASMTLGATAPSGTINWYATQTSTAVLGTGTTFATPSLSATTTYYAGVDNTSSNSFTKTFTGSSTRNDNYLGMVFNTISKVVLNSIKVYPKQTATGDNLPITLALLDAAGNLIAGPTTFTPNSNITTTLVAQTVTLNYNVPVGNGYKLFVIGGLTPLNGIGRLATNTLPITQGAISITNSVDSYNAVPTATSTSTLSMFDWTWTEICSTARIPVVATVNAIVTPTFTQVAAICSGTTLSDLPLTSNNGITGTWSPAISNTATTTYTFTPTAGLCSTTATMTIIVNPNVTPTFTQVAAICSGATLSALPLTSNNGITGIWSPAISNTTTTTYTFTPTVGLCATTATMTITVNPNVTPTFTQVAAICSGATLSALPTTSNNAITGTWSPAISNTTTTTYTFTPTVGSCATTATMTITVNPNVTPTFTQVAAICSGATLSALPLTSNNGITGTWSPAINNLVTTSYSFTPTTGLCATQATMTIAVIQNTTPTFTQVAAICSGATLSALPLTSNNGITGTWSPAISNTATTIYTFTPTTGLCATTAIMTITVNPVITTSFTQVAAICSGTSFAMPTTSNNGITGTWSPAFDNTMTMPYLFTPTTGLCATQATMTVTVNSTPAPTGATTQSLSSNLTVGNIVVSGTNIVWYASASNAATGTNPLPNSTLLANTTYYATQTIGGCASTLSLAVTITTLANQEFESVKFSYYPNPVIDQLWISADKEINSIEVYNLIGQRVIYLEPNISDTKIDFVGLPSAIYLVKLHANGVTKDIKVIKK